MATFALIDPDRIIEKLELARYRQKSVAGTSLELLHPEN